MLMLLIQVSLIALVVGQQIPITVVRENDGPLDLSTTDLTTSYCEAKGEECLGPDLESEFAADPHECHARCNRNLQCLSAFYIAQTCHLRAARCSTADELRTSTGATTYYRLKKGESCPPGQSAYVEASKAYSDSFCLIPDKSCPGHNLYPTPLSIQPFRDCLKKCARIQSCAGVDFDEKCSPKSYECSKDELVDTPGVDHFTRLEEGVTTCPCKEEVCINKGPEEAPLMVKGTIVKRGCDWPKDWDIDGGPAGRGRVTKSLKDNGFDGRVSVKWFNDPDNQYSYYMSYGIYRLALA